MPIIQPATNHRGIIYPAIGSIPTDTLNAINHALTEETNSHMVSILPSATTQIQRWVLAQYHKLSASPFPALTIVEKSYSGASGIDVTNSFSSVMPGLIAAPNANPSIHITHIKRGLAYIDNHLTHYSAFKDTSLATLLTMTRYHRCAVFKVHKHIFILTSVLNSEFIDKFLSVLPTLYTGHFEPNDYEQATQIAKALFEQDYDAFLPIMEQNYKEHKEEQTNRVYTDLYEHLKSKNSEEEKQIQRNIESVENQIKTYEDALRNYYSALLEHERRYTALLLSPPDTEKIDELIGFFKRQDNIQLIDTQKTFLKLKITTPLTQYLQQDVDSLFKYSKNPEILETSKQTTLLLRHLYLDRNPTHRLITTTHVKLPIHSAFSDRWTDENPAGASTIPNPHLYYYDCFNNYKSEVLHAVKREDYLGAALMLAQAASSINFADFSVIRRFADNLNKRIHGYYEDPPIIENIETKEMLTCKEFLQICKEKEPEDETDYPDGETEEEDTD